MTPAVLENTVVLYVDELNSATEEALEYVRAVRDDAFYAVHVPSGLDPGELADGWKRLSPNVELEVLSADGDPASAVIDYVHSLRRGEGDFVTAVIPELLPEPSLRSILRRRTQLALKLRLLAEPEIAVTDVSVVRGRKRDGRPGDVKRVVVLALVSGVHAASLRAASYARSLGVEKTGALFVALDPNETEEVEREWRERRAPVPLETVEAPFRDIGPPILDRVREITAAPNTLAAVVISELGVQRDWHNLLHNERAFYLKWLLLFEPRVILSTVPYQVR